MALISYSRDDVEIVRASDLFDLDWYLGSYADVGMLNMDPVVHYLWVGAKIGRDPSLKFSTLGYLRENPDVEQMGANPLVHYLTMGHAENRSIATAEEYRHWTPITDRYLERFQFQPLSDKKARVIAFYLPQFHPFKENDAWWGDGFTEWTNVNPARPNFFGHYQPHVPHDDIGTYSLLDRSAQLKQIELAKAYGIEGFCFYYYWFDGHRLMEKPIDNYLADPTLDHPFCLCWANENWSRRWDGLDSEILIAQNHSAEDDLGCIADLAKYIRDKRYIRIDGKPLVLIYRPSLLPDPKATAARWRRWCRDNGIGEIFLAYTQSFENEDPRVYGLDAAIEFPPNNSAPPNLTKTVLPFVDTYAGQVYDWRILVERSEAYSTPSYPLFRGVCPGWDNTARRKENGITFVNNTPASYQRWLHNAVVDTEKRFRNPDERVIFVNAWNEWAEGAHLEPDQRNGYAYLEATRAALDATPQPVSLGVVIHAFYPDVLREIVDICGEIEESFKYFVTTNAAVEEEVRTILQNQDKDFTLLVLPNRGRDVLPFLKVLEQMEREGIEFFAKVHTKRSLHRADGAQWRRELYDAVIGRDTFAASITAMRDDPRIGMLGPDGHLVSMDTYLGSNLERITKYAGVLGVSPDRLLEYSFFAGTMFIARVESLRPILTLGLTDQDFEDEAGQIDGTLAHTLERILTICVLSRGYRIGASSAPTKEVTINTRYGFA
ncbi:glycoside hydrolase family 99-like domain-containing protein [Sphingomonas sp. UYP23]